jgi:hypothetical protein
MFITTCKYACIAALAGFLITGGPETSFARATDTDILGDLGLAFEAPGVAYSTTLPACGKNSKGCSKSEGGPGLGNCSGTQDGVCSKEGETGKGGRCQCCTTYSDPSPGGACPKITVGGESLSF